jgi:hypothetical protein
MQALRDDKTCNPWGDRYTDILFFVSARTNKKHHHRHLRKSGDAVQPAKPWTVQPLSAAASMAVASSDFTAFSCFLRSIEKASPAYQTS